MELTADAFRAYGVPDLVLAMTNLLAPFATFSLSSLFSYFLGSGLFRIRD